MKPVVAPAPVTAMPASDATRHKPLLSLVLLLLGVSALPLGLLWDFSWESSIGADPFWAPPHAAMHIGALLAGLAAFSLLLAHHPVDESISLWRFRAPVGVWFTFWAAVLVLTATLFDCWWQGAYGAPSEAAPPPQLMSAAGSIGLLGGALMFAASRQNRAPGGALMFAASRQNRAPGGALFRTLFVAVAALLLVQVWSLNVTFSYPNQQHSADFYQRACAFYPVILLAVARAGKSRWSATTAAALYLSVVCCFVWILPLVPARPLAPPVYNDLKTMMPPPFPLLLIAPALLVDLLIHRARAWNEWLLSALAGALFLVSFALVQWPFASFLLTSAADNWFFAGGGKHWPFFVSIDVSARTLFWDTGRNPVNVFAVLVAAICAIGSARLGLWCGKWLALLRR